MASDVAMTGQISMIHPVEPAISNKFLSNQQKDGCAGDNEHGNRLDTGIRDASVTVDAILTRQLSPIRRDILPTTKLSKSINDPRKNTDICDASSTADAVPLRQLSPLRSIHSQATRTSPSVHDPDNIAPFETCARVVPISPVLHVAVQPVLPVPVQPARSTSPPALPLQPADVSISVIPSGLPPVPLSRQHTVLPVKTNLPVLPPIQPVKPVSSALPISTADRTNASTTKRCASVTAALTAAAAATAATKRLTARNKLICLSSSMDIDDKPPHEFMSLSLSPPLNRRREMPALRGPFVSL